MCGIFVVHSRKLPLDLDLCSRCFNELEHRGPDYSFERFFPEQKLFLGQKILSITGSPEGQLSHFHKSLSDRFQLIFNGEIYNHKALKQRYLKDITMLTETDTEVLVKIHDVLPPEDVFTSLSGMFAYVCFDVDAGELYIGRDLIGEKCLYKYEDENVLILSSEILPILNYTKALSINEDKLLEYFHTRHLLVDSDTMIQGVSVIEAGTLTAYSLNSGSWGPSTRKDLGSLVDIDLLEKNYSRTEDDLLEELDSLFKCNAELLMPSGEYGSVFSGGIDSSLASFYMLQQANKPQLYCLTFGKKDLVSQQLPLFEQKIDRNIEAVEVTSDLFLSQMKKAYRHTMMPLATHSFVSQQILAECVRENNQKVLVGGDGADELLGGYEAYRNLDFTHSETSNPSPYSGVVDNGINRTGLDLEAFYSQKAAEWEDALTLFAGLDASEARFQAALFLDTKYQLESVGLRSSDLMSMANSVECRGFFVTHDVMKFAINLPIDRKVDQKARDPRFVTKPLLKKLFARHFGEDLLFPKQGFSGYPNEAAKRLLNDQYHHVDGLLLKSKKLTRPIKMSQALEWKFMNVELFLRSLPLGIDHFNPIEIPDHEKLDNAQ